MNCSCHEELQKEEVEKEEENLERQEKGQRRSGCGNPMRKDNLAKEPKGGKAGPRAQPSASIVDKLAILPENALKARREGPKEIGRVARQGSATSVEKRAT